MGKVELTIQVDEDLLARITGAGVEVAMAVEAGMHLTLARLANRPIGIVASAAWQKADPIGAEERSRKWAEENAEAIADHNRFIEKHGSFGAEFRKW